MSAGYHGHTPSLISVPVVVLDRLALMQHAACLPCTILLSRNIVSTHKVLEVVNVHPVLLILWLTEPMTKGIICMHGNPSASQAKENCI